MKPFPDGHEDVSIREANDKFVWQAPLHPVTVETFYFNVDANEASSEELCKSARMDSEERSESKHSSIKTMALACFLLRLMAFPMYPSQIWIGATSTMMETGTF